MKESEKEFARLSVKITKEKLNRFAFLCQRKNVIQREVINALVDRYIKSLWTDKIDLLYKEIKNHDQNIKTMQTRNE